MLFFQDTVAIPIHRLRETRSRYAALPAQARQVHGVWWLRFCLFNLPRCYCSIAPSHYCRSDSIEVYTTSPYDQEHRLATYSASLPFSRRMQRNVTSFHVLSVQSMVVPKSTLDAIRIFVSKGADATNNVHIVSSATILSPNMKFRNIEIGSFTRQGCLGFNVLFGCPNVEYSQEEKS